MEFEDVNARLVRLMSADAKAASKPEVSELALCMTHVVAEVNRLREQVAELQLAATTRQLNNAP